MKKALIFLMGIVSCRIFGPQESLTKSLTPHMHQISTKMAESISPVHTKEVSEYIFSSFAEPAMMKFINKMSLNIPDVKNMLLSEKVKVAQEISAKLGAEYKEHLHQSLHQWVKSLQTTHQSLRKRQDEMQVKAKPRKRLNTFGLFANNNRGRWIAGLVSALINMPLWLTFSATGWGSLMAYTVWSEVVMSPVMNRILFGSWM